MVMPSKRPPKKELVKTTVKPVADAVFSTNRYHIQTTEEQKEVEWLVKDGTYRSVAHYEEIMTRQMAVK